MVLALNAGSSSLKWSVFAPGPPMRRRLRGRVERVGRDGGARLAVTSGDGPASERPVNAPDHASALHAALDYLAQRGEGERLMAVGHRVVHGGTLYDEAREVSADLLAELRRWSALDPDHLPAERAIIEAMAERAPHVPQVACFDTTFHRTMPRVARLLAIPRRFEASGVRRYGFHGLSYAFLMEELTRVAGPEAAAGRVVLAHLGAGASLAAVAGGRPVDTTMGFTPASGVMMATRSGDLDPGVLVHLMRTERMGADEIDDLVNRRSGLLGVSDSSADMAELLAREGNDPRAADAVSLFCYQVKKAVGALAAALGGLDTLVFSGGIGENAPAVRGRIVRGLEHLGTQLNEPRNDAGAAVISTDASGCVVRVVATDEESVIARETLRVMGTNVEEGARS
jgi:acetate kinase